MPAEPDPAGTRGQNPYMFAVGCPRSGTTLLQRMLDSHPGLAVANDTHFIPRALQIVAPQAIGDATAGRDVPLTGELVEGVRNYHRFYRLGLSGEDVRQAAAKSRTYRQFVAALYARFAGLHGEPRAGEKTPDYVRHLPLLDGLFPWAKTVHLVRDGRNVALSLLDWATPRTAAAPSASVAARADSCLRWWNEELARRKQKEERARQRGPAARSAPTSKTAAPVPASARS